MNEYDGLIFDLSVPGRVGYSLPESDVPEADPARLLPAAHLRRRPAALPEVSELDAVRHFTRLSRMNFGARHALLSARLLHDEVQPEDQRGRGARSRASRGSTRYTPEDAAQGALAADVRARARCWPRSPAWTRSRCSRPPARRAS